MKKIIYIFGSLLLSLAMILGFAACSDSSDEPVPEKPYEMIYSSTMMLRQAWKITEHEYADKSYYTKDFKTSWVINQGFSYQGETYFPFSYKLSLQTEIHYVKSVEVGAFPNGDLCIVDTETNQPVFFIEDMYSGGNKDVMIIRDREGNRFRCESVKNASIYFLENCTSKTSLKLHYVEALTGTSSTEIDYTVASLPQREMGAYSVLLEDTDALVIDITSTDGGYAQLTSSDLTFTGYMRGEITDEGLSYGGDNPTPDPDPIETGYDTKAEQAIKGVFMNDEGSFFINEEVDGNPIRSFSFNSIIHNCYNWGFRVRIDEAGNRWITREFFEDSTYQLVDYAEDGSSMSVCNVSEPYKVHKLKAAPDATVAFIYNASSYGLFFLDYLSYTNGGVTKELNKSYMLYKGDFEAAVPYVWTYKSSPIEVNLKVIARKDPAIVDNIEFDFKATIPPGSSRFLRIHLTDDDVPHSITADEISQLESFFWVKNSARAWRLSQIEYNGQIDTPTEKWLITEAISMEQGLHSNILEIDGLFYLSIGIDGNAKLSNLSGTKSYSILSSLKEIVEEGKLVLKYGSRIYTFQEAIQPLIIYCQRDSSAITGPRVLTRYCVEEYDSYDNRVSYKEICGTPTTLNEYPAIAGWALISDKSLVYSDGSRFNVKGYYSIGSGYHTGLYKNLSLGQVRCMTVI